MNKKKERNAIIIMVIAIILSIILGVKFSLAKVQAVAQKQCYEVTEENFGIPLSEDLDEKISVLFNMSDIARIEDYKNELSSLRIRAEKVKTGKEAFKINAEIDEIAVALVNQINEKNIDEMGDIRKLTQSYDGVNLKIKNSGYSIEAKKANDKTSGAFTRVLMFATFTSKLPVLEE